MSAAAGRATNFGSHCRVVSEADGSRRLVGSSFREGLLSGELTFWEFDEGMQLLHSSRADLPVRT